MDGLRSVPSIHPHLPLLCDSTGFLRGCARSARNSVASKYECWCMRTPPRQRTVAHGRTGEGIRCAICAHLIPSPEKRFPLMVITPTAYGRAPRYHRMRR
jgi:hypothetical protein